ncbi:MAG TPA: MerR family DNA-binding transcriptional regulator [Polyangiales bacterium]|nr:MerR family DNA-binding transcriptional regulator [Polyangiales bacterium]
MTKQGESVSEFLKAHQHDGADEVYGIADLVRDFEVTARALRLYEEKGLLAPRRLNGSRIYTRRDRARLTLILRAKSLGSSLEEIKEYLDLYGQHGEGRKRQLEYVVSKTAAAIRDLEQKRTELERTLSELRIIHEGASRQLKERRIK